MLNWRGREFGYLGRSFGNNFFTGNQLLLKLGCVIAIAVTAVIAATATAATAALFRCIAVFCRYLWRNRFWQQGFCHLSGFSLRHARLTFATFFAVLLIFFNARLATVATVVVAFSAFSLFAAFRAICIAVGALLARRPLATFATIVAAGIAAVAIVAATARRRFFFFGRFACEEVDDALPQRRAAGCAGFARFFAFNGNRRRLCRSNALDGGFQTLGLFFLGLLRLITFLGRRFHHLVGRQSFINQVQFVVTQTRNGVVRRFQMHVRNQHHADFQAGFDGEQFGAFFVQEESGDIDRHLCVHGAGVVLHGFFLNDAQDVQRGRFNATDKAGAMATRAGDVAGFFQRRLQTLAREFE